MVDDGNMGQEPYAPLEQGDEEAEDDETTGIGSQRTPLLGEMMEAGSVTVALAAESAVEGDRPKSSMSSAFMNMANSIM